MKAIILFAGILVASPLFAGDVHPPMPVDRAPAKSAAWPNPYDSQDGAKQAGAKLYQRHCAACHGSKAAGRGGAPALASPDVRTAAPGALFWVLRNGSLRRGMPSFSHIPEKQRWQIVTYLKTL
jgi:mono/diheme cytochrome c family protein